jgi:hypothetical protein
MKFDEDIKNTNHNDQTYISLTSSGLLDKHNANIARLA